MLNSYFFSNRLAAAFFALLLSFLLSNRSQAAFYENIKPAMRLHYAAKENNLAAVKELIATGHDLNALCDYGNTPLHFAAKRGHVEMVKLLLANGADPQKIDPYGNTPLHETCLHDYENYTACLSLLLEKGARADARNANGKSSLHLLCEKTPSHWKDAFKSNAALLIAHGAPLSGPDKEGKLPLSCFPQAQAWTPLHAVIFFEGEKKAQNVPVLEEMVRRGVPLDEKSAKFGTPFDYALTEGYATAASLLQKNGAPLSLTDPQAIELARKDLSSLTMLHLLAFFKNDMQDLIQRPYRNIFDKMANTKNADGDTPLHIAVKRNRADIAKYLLVWIYARVDEKNNQGQTPLHLASMLGHKQIAKLLIDKGANQQVTDLNGKTPADYSKGAGRQMAQFFKYGKEAEDPSFLKGLPRIETQYVQERLEPPEEPILRTETGSHTAAINRMALNREQSLLATVSDDKTIRLWSPQTGRLLKIIRVPINEDRDGMLYSVAMAPDGQKLAVGGWTGLAWEGRSSVYIFEIPSGRMSKRLALDADSTNGPRLPLDLAFSADGKHLAVAFGTDGTAGGVYLFDTRRWQAQSIWPPKKFGHPPGNHTRLAVDRQGRLAAVEFTNRKIHLYDAQQQHVAALGIGSAAVAFSPDGQRLAISDHYSTSVKVVATGTQALLASPVFSQSDAGAFGSLCFSADGRFLYGGGTYADNDGHNPVRRWSGDDFQQAVDLPGTKMTIMDLIATRDGGVLYAAADPAMGRLDATGASVFENSDGIADFRGNYETFKISADGSVVQFAFAEWGREPARFSLFDQRLEKISDAAAQGDDLISARVDIASAPFTAWRKDDTPVKALHDVEEIIIHQLNKEIPLSRAIDASRNRVLLGSDIHLYLYDGSKPHDRNVRWVWAKPVPAAVWNLAITPDGQLAVAALGDGTIRWYRMVDGTEVMAMFPQPQTLEWIAWTPQGYYLCSPRGDDLIGWHMNNGKEAQANFYSARQFERILFRPDTVLRHFKNRGTPHKDAADEDFSISRLNTIAPPLITIESPRIDEHHAKQSVVLQFNVEASKLAVEDFSVYVNHIPVVSFADRSLTGPEQRGFHRLLTIPLFAKENTIRIEAFNGKSMGVAETVLLRETGAKLDAKGSLYLLSIGVNHFPLLNGADLDYAAMDAEGVARFFQTDGRQQFKQIMSKVLSDNSDTAPTRDNVVQAAEFLSQSKAEDTVIIFLASHGLSDPAGNYYFVPRDASQQDLENIFNGKLEAPSLVNWRIFFEAMRKASGKRLMIVDTCQAKGIAGTLDFHSLAKRSASSSFVLLAASQATEESQEYPKARHGLFTYALLQGLAGSGDQDRNGQVTLAELHRYVTDFVATNRNKEIGPQTPQMVSPKELAAMVLAGS